MKITEKRLDQLANDPMICNISAEVQNALRELIVVREALTSIKRILDPDNEDTEECIRADDPETAMDTAHSLACSALEEA